VNTKKENKEYEVDDITKNVDKKKKIKSGKKGNRGENSLAKTLSARFNQPFSRIPQSGARFSQVALPQHVKEAYVGDLITPPGFRYAIECKHGYNEIDFNLLVGKNSHLSVLDEMLAQAERDAGRIGRQPLLCLKQDYGPWICFVRHKLPKKTHTSLVYGKWKGFGLDHLLEEPDSWFFPKS
jgi:hypothetical protein